MKATHQVVLLLVVTAYALSGIPGTFAQFTMNTKVKHTVFATANVFPNNNRCPKKNTLLIDHPNTTTLRFTIACLDKDYNTVHYTLTYDTDTVTREIEGEQKNVQGSFVSSLFTLGSCSTDEVCIYDKHIHTIHLTILLIEDTKNSLKLEKTFP